ncbi:hypothetical protein OESDEN_23956 [Oesophagostomum dentatum]|uniref:Uncharacterized protein n=1 Tax=Oesophagostomum dentatum TaxID=61180 RepID=A0A0B1RUR4_OESDE|nr:hypothetical protein OESDEN_23956 [Oesophagostomum dentatum]
MASQSLENFPDKENRAKRTNCSVFIATKRHFCDVTRSLSAHTQRIEQQIFTATGYSWSNGSYTMVASSKRGSWKII